MDLIMGWHEIILQVAPASLHHLVTQSLIHYMSYLPLYCFHRSC